MLALEIEFEKGLYLNNKGYDTNVNYDLIQPLKNLVAFIQCHQQLKLLLTPWVTRDLQYPSFCLPQRKASGIPPHQVVCRHFNFDDSPPPAVDSDDKKKRNSPQHPWMTWYSLRNLHQILICAFIWLWDNHRLVTIPKYPPHMSLYTSQQSKKNVWIVWSVICLMASAFPMRCFSRIMYTHLWSEVTQTMIFKKYDTLLDTNNYNADALSIIFLTAGHKVLICYISLTARH